MVLQGTTGLHVLFTGTEESFWTRGSRRRPGGGCRSSPPRWFRCSRTRCLGCPGISHSPCEVSSTRNVLPGEMPHLRFRSSGSCSSPSLPVRTSFMPLSSGLLILPRLSRSCRHDLPPTRELPHRSGTAQQAKALRDGGMSGESDGDLSPLHDDRDLSLTVGQAEHLFELLRVFVDVHVDRPVAVGRPGLLRIGSGIGAVDDDLLSHEVHLGRFLPSVLSM